MTRICYILWLIVFGWGIRLAVGEELPPAPPAGDPPPVGSLATDLTGGFRIAAATATKTAVRRLYNDGDLLFADPKNKPKGWGDSEGLAMGSNVVLYMYIDNPLYVLDYSTNLTEGVGFQPIYIVGTFGTNDIAKAKSFVDDHDQGYYRARRIARPCWPATYPPSDPGAPPQ